jgi:hypothetical protein
MNSEDFLDKLVGDIQKEIEAQYKAETRLNKEDNPFFG